MLIARVVFPDSLTRCACAITGCQEGHHGSGRSYCREQSGRRSDASGATDPVLIPPGACDYCCVLVVILK